MILKIFRQLFRALPLVILLAGQVMADAPQAPVWNGGTVRVAIPRDFPPTYYQDSRTGMPAGFAVDITNEIASRAGLKVEYVYGKAWQEIEEMVLDGRADMAPHLAINKERKERFNFTPPVETVAISLFVLESNADIKGLAPGLAVGTMQSSVGATYMKERDDLEVTTYISVHKMLFDLLAGQIDAAVIAELNLKKLAQDAGVDDKIRVVGKPLFELKRGMALRKSDAVLHARLSGAISEFVGTPRYIELYEKWWSKPKPYWNTRRVVFVVLFAVLVVALVMGGWRFATISQLNSKLNSAKEDLIIKQKQLETLNVILEERVAREVEKNRDKDRMMIHQGRLAAMGEMIGNIAHQWRQPLNNIGLLVQEIQMDYEDGMLDTVSVQRMVGGCMDHIMYMSRTIDDFRSFFRPDKEKQLFEVGEALNRVHSLVHSSFENSEIALHIIDEGAVSIVGYANEYCQALLNIINNAKDALQERGIEIPTVVVRCGRLEGKSLVTVLDNAGGIEVAVIDKIFDPYFTTKEKSQGTGLGLYMAKMIIEKNMGGSLTVRNLDCGAEFRIVI